MKPKTLLILSITAIILILIAGLNRSRTSRERVQIHAQKLFPDLDVNEIEKIVVTTSEEEVVVARHDDKWVCESKHNYPANFDKIRSVLMTLTDLKKGETRVTNASPDQKRAFEALSPRSDTASAGTGIDVALFDKNDQLIHSLVLGKPYTSKAAPHTPDMFQLGASSSGRFIAVDNSIHLVAEPLHRLDDKSVSWLNADLLNVPASDIVAMRIEDREGNSIEMFRPEPGQDFIIPDMAGNEEIQKWAVDSLARTFTHLTFSDLPGPETDNADTGLDNPVMLKATAKDGKIYVLSTGERVPGKTENYAKLMIAIDHEKISQRAKDEEKTPDDTGTTESRKKINEEVAGLNARFRKWIYTIPAHRADNITTDREKFLKTEPEPEPETDTEDTELSEVL